eukprot:5842343-Pyramimonas_sp.AAC.1
MGDLEFYANHLGAPSSNSVKMCWACDGNRSDNPWNDFNKDPWALKLTICLTPSPLLGIGRRWVVVEQVVGTDAREDKVAAWGWMDGGRRMRGWFGWMNDIVLKSMP